MIYYKVRRKSDGAFHPFERRTKQKQDSFYRQYRSAVDWYNGMGWDGDEQKLREKYRNKTAKNNWIYHYYTTEDSYVAYWKKVPTYDDIELVKFGPEGEVVIASGVKCALSKKEADKLKPSGAAPLTLIQKQAGIRDEIGPMLDKIDSAQETLTAGKLYDVGALFAEIDMKKTKLAAALEELEKRSTELHGIVNKILLS